MTKTILPKEAGGRVPFLTAIQIIEKHQSKGAPVHVVPIARSLGVEVYRIETLPKDFSGMIRKEENGKYAIYVNASHPEVRRRFTVAHELAHFIMHFESIGDGLFDDALYRSGLSNKQEIEANALAAKILMPWKLIRQAVDELESVNVEKLARIFNVSKQAMSIRLGDDEFFSYIG